MLLSKLQWKLASPVSSNSQRQMLMKRLRTISKHVPCPHNESEILSIPKDKEGCIVETGSYKGGSTAKFSLFTKLANRQLIAFDPFGGLPENVENHDKSILGHSIRELFVGGKFCGSLEEVKNNVRRYGELEVCTFIKGWFEDTMPAFSMKIAVVYLDVDLASSTKTCLKFLYPLIIPGGVLYSQDGDIPLVIEVFNDDEFWEKETGFKKPNIEGLGKKKLIRIVKDTE